MTLTFLKDTIPTQLQQHPRWFLWTLAGDGKKVPRRVSRPDQNINATKPSSWTDFAKASEAAVRNEMGVGFALGSVQDGPTFAGVDLDQCRNPETGVIEPWARRIVDYCNSYTEISPSGTGLKIFLLGSLPDGAKQGKVYKLEIYDRGRYFTVTGQHLKGTPSAIEERTEQLRDLHSKAWSQDLVTLTKIFDLYIGETPEWVNLHCPWEPNHSGSNQERDGGLHKTAGKIDGFNCFHAGCSERTLGDVRKFFGLKGGSTEWVTDHRGHIIADNQENVHRALGKLELELSFNLFDDRALVRHADGRVEPLTTPLVKRLWLLIDRTFQFRPSQGFLEAVCEDQAFAAAFHPVRDYLSRLQWDGTPRINRWLTTYGKAADSPFSHAVGALVLVAAVRRILRPGCKFDELLVLISGKQGTDKSSALQALCPHEAWFSDDLPLNVDAKQIIERTSGKWIIEAAELNGFGKRDVEHLKASLSRQVDGPVRMAYERLPSEKARQFIVIGTTNTHQFLKDKTGNRRFWPVEVKQFDVAGLRRDRDQLWAEAVHREAQGESIRLDPSLWSKAAQAQEARLVDDAWMPSLRQFLGFDDAPDGAEPPPATAQLSFIEKGPADRVHVDLIWDLLQIPLDRRDDRAAERVSSIMQSLGYEKKRQRGITGDDRKRVLHRWCLAECSDVDEGEP